MCVPVRQWSSINFDVFGIEWAVDLGFDVWIGVIPLIVLEASRTRRV